MRSINGLIFINRYNLYPATPITGSLKPGVSSGDVIAGLLLGRLGVLPCWGCIEHCSAEGREREKNERRLNRGPGA